MVPLECVEPATSEPHIEGRRVGSAVAAVEVVEKWSNLGWDCDSVALPADSGSASFDDGVDGNVVAVVRAPADRAQRRQGVSYAAWGEPLRGELVGEVLQHCPVDRGELFVDRGVERCSGLERLKYDSVSIAIWSRWKYMIPSNGITSSSS